MDALRDQRALPWLDDLTRDIRYALRTLRRSPVFTTVVLLTLAIGIGANTAVFSVVDAIVIEPLPYPDAGQLVAVKHVAPGAPGPDDGFRRPAAVAVDVLHIRRAEPRLPGVRRVFPGDDDGDGCRGTGAGAIGRPERRHAPGTRRPADPGTGSRGTTRSREARR
jgi:hypothetical protein